MRTSTAQGLALAVASTLAPAPRGGSRTVGAMLRLYRVPHSPNVDRVALALAYQGLEVESITVDPGDRAPVRAVSGQDLVPVLVEGGTVIHDSSRILQYLDRRVPDRPLFPADAAARATVDVFIDWFNRAWKHEPNRIADALERGDADPADLARWTDRVRRRLDWFDALLTDRDHLFGAFGAADCAAWPFLRYAVSLDPDDPWPFHRALHERMGLEQRHERLRAWIARVGARPRV
jgi:glutathione S-transferase